MAATTLPNLMIAGAPRCGTTTLFSYLSAHPTVCGASVKETYYLMDTDYPLYQANQPNYHRDGLGGYASYFDCNAQYYLDATPDYLYQDTVLDVLADFPHAVQIIFMLRKPSERVWSYFKTAQNNLSILPAELSFTDFLRMVDKPVGTPVAGNTLLEEIVRHSCYSTYLEQFQTRLAGKHQLYVYLLEDMRTNPQVFMQKLAAQIGLETSFYGEAFNFTQQNKTLSVRNHFLHRSVRRLQTLLPQKLQVQLFWGDSWYKRLYHRFNVARKGTGRNPEDEQRLVELEGRFAPCKEWLQKNFKMDLSLWE